MSLMMGTVIIVIVGVIDACTRIKSRLSRTVTPPPYRAPIPHHDWGVITDAEWEQITAYANKGG